MSVPGSERVCLSVFAGEDPLDLEGIPLDPVVAQEAVRPDFPNRRAAHLEWRTVGLGAHQSVVAAGHLPAGHNAAAVPILEGLVDVELEVVHLRLEVLHPGLEGAAP